MKRQLTRFLKDIVGILKEAWWVSRNCGFCCEIRLDAPTQSGQMPTPGSCCGVRF